MKQKRSFTLYNDYWHFFRLLTNEELGGLLRAIYNYENDAALPKELSEKADIAFEMVRSNLDKERRKYEKICERNQKTAEQRWQKYKNGANIDKNIQM